MLTTALAASVVLAYHDTAAGDNLMILFVFLGATATAGWLLFSRLAWRNTVVIAAAAWALGLALTFGF